MMRPAFANYGISEYPDYQSAVEAAFRKELVLAEDDKSHCVEAMEYVPRIMSSYLRLYFHYGYFDLWVSLYDQGMHILPYVIIIMGADMLTGIATIGVMWQIMDVFGKVHWCFSLFLHNWTTVTELRSIRMRLKEFEENLEKHEREKPKNVLLFPVQKTLFK